MLTQLLWIHLASLFRHAVASLATATSLAAAGRVLLSPPLGKAVPPAPQYRRHHPDLSRLEPVTCLDSLMASDVCQHPLHTHPAHCPTRFDSSPDPGPRLRGDVGTGSGGAGSPPTFTNQQLGELILCAPRFEGAECCILPTGGGSRTWRRLEQRVNAAAAFRQRQLQRLQKDTLPPQRPLLGQLPHCADKRQGRRSSCVAPALICRWEADRLAPLPAARAPGRRFLGPRSSAYVHGCIPAQPPGRGFPWREEVQAVLAGGQNTAVTLQPWLSAPIPARRLQCC